MQLLNFSIALLVILASLIYWYIRRSFSYLKSKGIPHVKPEIPWGNVKGLATTVPLVSFTKDFYAKFKGITKVCGLYLFTRPILLLMDLDLIKNVLVKDFTSFSDRSFYYNDKDDPLSGHLVALDGKKWKNIRTKLTPTFTSGKMRFMYPTIKSIGDRLTEHLHGWCKENDEFDMKSILSRFTMDVIGTCAFGIECNTLRDIDNDFYRMSRTAMEKPRHNQRLFILMNDMKHIARFFGMKSIRDDVSEFFMNVVQNTIDYREKNNIQRNDFMDLLIKLKTEENDSDASKGLTVNQIAAQSFLFFVAGYETSSTAMLFAMYELALNPQIQTKLRQEVKNAFKKHNGEFSYEMMMDIPYLDQTINETLRKYPPFTTLRRVAQVNYKVPGTNYVIDKGVTVTVPVCDIHNDPEYYPEPQRFDPERFSPEEVKKRHPMTFLPFGEGPRNCIALRFDMMQVRIGLITLLNSFEFTTCAKTPVSMEYAASSIVITPKEKIYLNIKPIKTT